MSDWSETFSMAGRRARVSEVQELLKLLTRPGLISFAGGVPDPAFFPRELARQAHERVLSDPEVARQALNYSITEGYEPLREAIVRHMRGLGVPCEVDNILITNGCQQALSLVGQLFLDAGDRVLAARPTYFGALQAFDAYGPQFATLTPEGALPPAKLGYIMPDFANPTGVSLTREERLDVLDRAEAAGAVLVEDTAYSALYYDGPPPPSLLALDAERRGGVDAARVIYCGTFSKTVLPGLRIGWVVAPRPVIAKLVLLKQGVDLHAGTLAQTVMVDVLRDLDTDHLARIRDAYSHRRDAMLAALADHMPQGVTWTRPGGGLFVWLDLPRQADSMVLVKEAIDRANVAFVPGVGFYAAEPETNTMRLSYSLCDEARIRKGVAALAEVVRDHLEARGALSSAA